MPKGIDVYVKYQKITDWNAVKSAGFDWCYHKVSDGTTTRPVNDISGGKSAGILQGGYHFSQPGDPVIQANLLLNQCSNYGAFDLNPALDLEDNTATSGLPNIPDNQKGSWAVAFGRRIMEAGHGFSLYANDSTWGIIYNQVMQELPHTFRWNARYGATPRNPYDAWQYSSLGSVPGISAGSVDLNQGAVPINIGGVIDLTPEEHDWLNTLYKTASVRYADSELNGGRRPDGTRIWDAGENVRRLINDVRNLAAKVDSLTVNGATIDYDLLASKVVAAIKNGDLKIS